MPLSFPGMAGVEKATLIVDGPGVNAVGPFLKGAGQVEVAADAVPGMRQLRLVGPKSVTAPRPFMVTALPVLLEKEPNNRTAQAQPVEKLPTTLNGTLSTPNDVDVYRVTLHRGDCLVMASESRLLAAPTNLRLVVRDPAGREVPTRLNYRRRDPWYACTAPADGDYTLQLSEVTNNQGGGSDDFTYWLTLTTGPWTDYVTPIGARPGEAAHLMAHGWNLDGKPGPGTSALELTVGPELASVAAPGAPNAVPLSVASEPLLAEAEPNDDAAHAQPLPVPSRVNGTFQARGDRDYYRFGARKGETYRLQVEARDFDSFADPVLTLQDASGRELESIDDIEASRDPRLFWTASADGTYTVLLRDLAGTGRGGPEFYYCLSVTPAAPELRLTAAEPAVTLKPGARVELTLNVYQAYQPGAVTLQVEGLPEGVTAAPVAVSASPRRSGRSQVRLALTAAANAPPGFGTARVVASTGGIAPLTSTAEWMITGDGGWSFGTGSTTLLTVLVPAP